MTTGVSVDLDALGEMSEVMAHARDDLPFSHQLTGDCTAALGSGEVAAALAEVSRHLARRVDRLVAAITDAARLPRRFAEELRAADESLAGVAAGTAGVAAGTAGLAGAVGGGRR
ncbi:hypothetical protein [Frigoribacterium sp. CFBP 13707]|uniref:hypothetical protein n=1 Tax=Frigoribacterium sp. CFBP 13707 TaxID=2775313 RepID=UPI00178481EE|nr:hypothetical protein [Frigoribacterium sp. CFBP 13707]MBD8727699.1 hypothetical protein [Frigoribacterium sp. CFBP 13707]